MFQPLRIAVLPIVLAISLLAVPALMAQVPEEDADAEAADPAPDTAEEEVAEEAPPEGLDEVAREQLREEIRAELRAEMRADLERQRDALRAEMQETIAARLAAQEWEPDVWEVEEAPRPSFFELDGYFRARADVFVNFDLNAGVDVHAQPLFPRPATPGSDTLTSANQRLRLDPTLNISEEIKVRGTVDVLDNLVWGQTPDAYPRNLATQTSPMLAFTGTQVAPQGGQNAARDSILVKRVWGEVLTPVGLLRFGRMGSHWGLGILANDGDDLDADFGSNVDRLMFVTRVADHFIVPAVDVMSVGPLFQPADVYQGQPFDLENRDDVIQYILAVARRDTDDEIRRQVLDGRMVINYGVYNVLRRQTLDYVRSSSRIFGSQELGAGDFIRRDALAYIPDVWFRLNTARLRVEFEAAAILGRIGNGMLFDEDPEADNTLLIRQIGAVAQADYSFMRDRLRVGLETGFASGDDGPGMGIFAAPGGRSSPPEPGAIDGRQFNLDDENFPIDNRVTNFKFHRAYYIDEILWRRVLGQITDAIYIRPSVTYDLTNAFGFDLAGIYSRAVFTASTPGEVADLGVELNAGLRYRTRDGFVFRGIYGILFPLGGLELEREPEIAQAIRVIGAITF
jgi:uncharacterized protein (TIGR04551 family)